MDPSFEQLLQEYDPYICTLARIIHFSPEMQWRFGPSDLAQDMRLKLAKNQEEFRRMPEDHRRAWLKKKVKEHFIDCLRHHTADKRNPAMELRLQQIIDNSSAAFANSLAGKGKSPSQQAMATEQELIIARALMQLDESQREAVLLIAVHGLSRFEAAKQLDVPPGTVSGWYYRGLERLRTLLAPSENAGNE